MTTPSATHNDVAQPSAPRLLASDSTRPCPQCDQRHWLHGLTYRQCTGCGSKDGLTPQEILRPQKPQL